MSKARATKPSTYWGLYVTLITMDIPRSPTFYWSMETWLVCANACFWTEISNQLGWLSNISIFNYCKNFGLSVRISLIMHFFHQSNSPKSRSCMIILITGCTWEWLHMLRINGIWEYSRNLSNNNGRETTWKRHEA